MARAFGMHAERVEREEDLAPAIQRALANRPSLLDVVVSPEARSSDGKTGLAWVPDLESRGDGIDGLACEREDFPGAWGS